MPGLFNPADREEADRAGLLHELTVNLNAFEITADFRLEPEKVVAAELRKLADVLLGVAAKLAG